MRLGFLSLFLAALALNAAPVLANMMPPPELKSKPVTPSTPAIPATSAKPPIPAVPVKKAVEQKQPELPIKSFHGEWRGTALAESETDEDFPSSTRDIAVSIKPTDLGGFTLSWSTLQREKGDPKAPLEVMKSTSVEFIPSALPNRWQAKSSASPYQGGIVYWARLERSTLTLSTFTIDENGKPELQTYRRKVSGNTMKLDFTNVKDGQVVRVVSGSLKRQK
jgi:hypothetical protein